MSEQTSHLDAKQNPQGSLLARTLQQLGKRRVGLFSLTVTFLMPFWIVVSTGCGPPEQPQVGRRSNDPNLRYVGAGGAVAVHDNYGGETRLPPGTVVRATRSSFIDPMVGPIGIYLAIEGSHRGVPVPISEADLEPQ